MEGATAIVPTGDDRTQRIQRRSLIATVFLGFLIALAYQEAVPPVREAVRTEGITLETTALFIIFFLTTMRFFIGMQLQLLSPDIAALPGLLWLFDFGVFLLENTTFIFMGGAASVAASRAARFGFVDLLLFLYTVDVLWICSQWLLGIVRHHYRRKFIPWAWALINLSVMMIIGGLRIFGAESYSVPMLAVLLTANTVAFVIDVVLVDYFDLF